MVGDLPAAAGAGEIQPSYHAPLESYDLASYTRLVYQTVGLTDGVYNWEIMRAPMMSDNQPSQNLTNHSSYDITPRLSPDGGKVAFASNRDRNYEIYSVNWDGSGLSRLTTTGVDKDDTSPIWSPDGNRIAFTSDRDGNSEIYVMNADGTGQARLTYDSAAILPPPGRPMDRRSPGSGRSANLAGLYC